MAERRKIRVVRQFRGEFRARFPVILNEGLRATLIFRLRANNPRINRTAARSCRLPHDKDVKLKKADIRNRQRCN